MGALIKNNILTLPQNNTAVLAVPSGINIYGIRVMGSASVQVSGNTVQRSASNLPISTVAQKLYGISIENSASSKVHKNTLIRMGSGIHATGPCYPSTLYCNTLNSCYNGFFLNNASIGNQGGPGGKGLIGLTSDNVWTDLSGSVGDRILYQIPLTYPTTTFWYYKNGNTNLNPIYSQGAGITPNGVTQTFTCTTSTGLSGCAIQLKNFTPEEREGMFGEIVRNEKSFNNHEPEFKIHEKEMAFRELKEEGWLQLGAPDDALFQNFVDSIQLTNTGKLYDVRKTIEQNDLVLAESKNNSIVPKHLIEENQKTVNDLYIKVAKENRTEFDVTEAATLESISCQDPLEGGDAVYSARVMLRKENMCQGSAKMAWSGENENEQKQLNKIKNENISIGEIFPNPNNGNMQLQYIIEEKDKAVLKIFDVSGKLLFKQMLMPENNLLEIANFTSGNGVYYYSIEINDEKTINKKLVIIR